MLNTRKEKFIKSQINLAELQKSPNANIVYYQYHNDEDLKQYREIE